MLTMYDVFYSVKKEETVNSVLIFCYLVVKNVEINIEEGRKNPFSRVFQLIGICIDITKDMFTLEKEKQFRGKCQEIVNLALERIVGPEADIVMQPFGFDQPTEIQCFKELF